MEMDMEYIDPGIDIDITLDQILEKEIFGVTLWMILYTTGAVVSVIVILLCCCVRFRIPRTKQEIEADYVRRQITRRFQKYLKMIEDSEMDEMDLQKALTRVKDTFDAEHQPSTSSSNADLCETQSQRIESDDLTEAYIQKLEQKKQTFKFSNMIQIFSIFPFRSKRVAQTEDSVPKPRELIV